MHDKNRSFGFNTPLPKRKEQLSNDLLYTHGKRTVAVLPQSVGKPDQNRYFKDKAKSGTGLSL
jgi:hypothetical protein